MYMVHAQLVAEADAFLPEDIPEKLTTWAEPDESIEYAVVHPEAADGPVIGLFMLAASWKEAETSATKLCRRVLSMHPDVEGISVLRCEGRLVAAYFDRMLGYGQRSGRIMSRPDHDTGNPFPGF